MTKSTQSVANRKVLQQSSETWSKPYPDFPLCLHKASGRLYKKINGKRYYYGYPRDWQAALERYLDEKDDPEGKRSRRSKPGDFLIKDLCNCFQNHQDRRMREGDISPRTRDEYFEAASLLVKSLKHRVVSDLRPDDFRTLRKVLAKGVGLGRLKKRIVLVKSIFRFGEKDELIDRLPSYGHGFDPPSKKALDREKEQRRKESGRKMFEADEIRLMLDHAGPQMKAAILLGINAGFGNNDIGELPKSAIDLGAGWIEFARPKTLVNRRCPLWPETIEALREAIMARPTPKDKENEPLVFITKYGGSFAKYERKDSDAEPDDKNTTPKKVASTANPLSAEFRKLVKSIDSHRAKQAKKDGTESPEPLYRKGVGFYALRHTTQTIGDQARDPVAVRAIMGHKDPMMSGEYREYVDDEQLKAVTDHIRSWLFESKGGEE